jgi:hypothetical protein
MKLGMSNKGAVAIGTASAVTISLAVLGFYTAWITVVSNKADAAMANYNNLQAQILQSQNTLQQEITQAQTDISWIKAALKSKGWVPSVN